MTGSSFGIFIFLAILQIAGPLPAAAENLGPSASYRQSVAARSAELSKWRKIESADFFGRENVVPFEAPPLHNPGSRTMTMLRKTLPDGTKRLIKIIPASTLGRENTLDGMLLAADAGGPALYHVDHLKIEDSEFACIEMGEIFPGEDGTFTFKGLLGRADGRDESPSVLPSSRQIKAVAAMMTSLIESDVIPVDPDLLFNRGDLVRWIDGGSWRFSPWPLDSNETLPIDGQPILEAFAHVIRSMMKIDSATGKYLLGALKRSIRASGRMPPGLRAGILRRLQVLVKTSLVVGSLAPRPRIRAKSVPTSDRARRCRALLEGKSGEFLDLLPVPEACNQVECPACAGRTVDPKIKKI